MGGTAETEGTTMTTYQHTASGRYNETMATLDDGRMVTINTQYGSVLPHGKHAGTCDQINKMGGRCNCGLLDGIDVVALVADARINGKLGPAPVAATTPETITASKVPTCPKCGTVCYGDCQAN
jgi:hypothetical protein